MGRIELYSGIISIWGEECIETESIFEEICYNDFVMKTKVNKRLFWYLKDGAEIDLANPSHVDMDVQQVLSSGKTEDVKRMLRILPPAKFRKSFRRVKKYLTKEVRRFWEAGLGDTGKSSKRDAQLS